MLCLCCLSIGMLSIGFTEYDVEAVDAEYAEYAVDAVDVEYWFC